MDEEPGSEADDEDANDSKVQLSAQDLEKEPDE